MRSKASNSVLEGHGDGLSNRVSDVFHRRTSAWTNFELAVSEAAVQEIYEEALRLGKNLRWASDDAEGHQCNSGWRG